MRWLKSDMWKAGIVIAGLLLFWVLMVWVPMMASASSAASGLAVAGTVQPTPTVDLTVIALTKEQLALQVKQLQNQLENQNNWIANNSTALIAAVATVIVALFGISQWAVNRRDERRKEIAAQDKDLRAQAEERFKTAVTALGNENEATQVGGAILLRSFLHKDDREIYGRYYTQIFDLAVAYLRLSSKSLPQDAATPLPLTPLRVALIAIFKEVFPLARSQNKGSPQSLDASRIKLDNAYLYGADLVHAWMPQASLRRVNLRKANLSSAYLAEADLREANLSRANFSGADLIVADLSRTNLSSAKITGANLSGVDFSGADLSWTILIDADISRTSLNDVRSLEGTDLRGVEGQTKEQLTICKAKGAIIDEVPTADLSQSAIAPPPPAQSKETPASPASPAQANTPPANTDKSRNTSSQPSTEP